MMTNKSVLTVDQVVFETKGHLLSNGVQTAEQAEKEIKSFLASKQLKKVAVRSRTDLKFKLLSLYLEFSFDGYVVENCKITQSLKV